jgi:hypothetical protein
MSSEKTLREPRKGSKVIIMGGILLLIVSLPLLGGGAYILLRNQETDSQSFTLSNVSRVTTPTYAYVIGPQGQSASTYEPLMARELRWTIKNNNPDKELFVGLTSVDSGYTYLKSFQSVVPKDWTYHYEFYNVSITMPNDFWPSGPSNSPIKPPNQETIWLKSSQGSDSMDITWSAGTGMYYLFIMNADGSNGIDADINLGYRVGMFTWLPYLLIPMGLIFVLAGLLVFRRR